jgi:hypothetical protein
MIPVAAEAGWAILGGLIPIIGLAGIALIIWRAVREPPEADRERAEAERRKERGEP